MRTALALITLLLSSVTGYAQYDARQRILLEPVLKELWMESSFYHVGRIAQVFGKEAAEQEALNRRMFRDVDGGFNVELVHNDPDDRFTAAEVMGPDIRFDMIWRSGSYNAPPVNTALYRSMSFRSVVGITVE